MRYAWKKFAVISRPNRNFLRQTAISVCVCVNTDWYNPVTIVWLRHPYQKERIFMDTTCNATNCNISVKMFHSVWFRWAIEWYKLCAGKTQFSYRNFFSWIKWLKWRFEAVLLKSSRKTFAEKVNFAFQYRRQLKRLIQTETFSSLLHA